MSGGFRWRCMTCKGELKTMKEKVSKTCNDCGRKAAEGFEDMAKGQFKQGFKKVIDARFMRDDPEGEAKKKIVEHKMGVALSRKEAKIRKKLQKEGLSEAEIEAGLKEYKKHMGGRT
jgi:hypothetical protein